LEICLGKKRRYRINIFNKKYILNENDMKENISISGSVNHTGHHLFHIINQIKDEINLIIFMDKARLKDYLKTLEKPERDKLLIRNLSSNSNPNFLKNNTINKHKIIIYVMDKESQDEDLLKKIENIYNMEHDKHLKIAIIYNDSNLSRNIHTDIEKQKESNKSKNVSLLYVCYELKYALKTNINIIHMHDDPNYSITEFNDLFQGRNLFNTRDFRDLGKKNFFVIKQKEYEYNYCQYNYIKNNTELNIEDYIEHDTTRKINNF
jgi:hypothetical protein